MKLRLRKIMTIASNNPYWILFKEGNITEPICLLDEFEAEQLFHDMVDEVVEKSKEKVSNV